MIDLKNGPVPKGLSAQLKSLFPQLEAHLHEVFWLTSPDLNHVSYISPSFESIWGVSVQDIYNDPHTWTRHIHPEDLGAVLEARELGRREQAEVIYRIIRPDETIRWIRDRTYAIQNSRGETVQLTGFAEDITNEKEAEAALVHSEQQYRRFFENMRQGVFFFDEEKRIQTANPAVSRILGFNKRELLQKRFTELSSHEWFVWEQDHIVPQLEAKGFASDYEKTMYHKDGHEVPVSVSISLMDKGDFGTCRYMAQIRDLSQEHEAARAHAMLQAQLEQSQKLETIGTLASGIAHDFNNILTPILGFASMAKDDIGEEQQLDLDQILKAAHRAKDLVKQILSFSRPDAGHMRSVLLYPLMREAMRMLRASLPSSVRVQLDVQNREDHLLANPTQLIQIFMNLGTNAFHAIGDEGTITMTARRIDLRQSADDNVFLPSDQAEWIEVSVRDTGSGMDAQTQSRIFDPFFSTKKDTHGTGLGLSVVQNLVEKHHGMIKVDSTLGKGSCFRIYFPLAGCTISPESPFMSMPPGGNERIILVDDEPTITLMCRKMLQRLGYQVTAFNRPEEALQAFSAQPDAFDLLVTDQVMPVIKGLQLVDACREIRRDLPVVMITGYSEDVTDDICQQHGIDAFLLKPIHIKDLGMAIRNVLDKA